MEPDLRASLSIIFLFLSVHPPPLPLPSSSFRNREQMQQCCHKQLFKTPENSEGAIILYALDFFGLCDIYIMSSLIYNFKEAFQLHLANECSYYPALQVAGVFVSWLESSDGSKTVRFMALLSLEGRCLILELTQLL